MTRASQARGFRRHRRNAVSAITRGSSSYGALTVRQASGSETQLWPWPCSGESGAWPGICVSARPAASASKGRTLTTALQCASVGQSDGAKMTRTIIMAAVGVLAWRQPQRLQHKTRRTRVTPFATERIGAIVRKRSANAIRVSRPILSDVFDDLSGSISVVSRSGFACAHAARGSQAKIAWPGRSSFPGCWCWWGRAAAI